MADARRAILRAGGLRACNSYTKLYLSIFGLWTWRGSPAVPPELILLPRWFYFNVHEMSSWTRAIVVPLSVIWALRPSVPLDVTLDELQADSRPGRRRTTLYESFWSRVFAGVNGLIKLVEVMDPVPGWRRPALKKAEEWLVSHVEGSDGLGAIFPAMVNAVIAFRCLGYEESHPLVQGQLRELERFEIEEAGEMRLQPCFSPVWDTALSAGALLAAETDGNEAPIQDALAWLLEREITVAGDWREKSLQHAPGGWCFEYRNDLYPDCDDTAEVLLLLAAVRGRTAELEARRQAAAARGQRWLLGLQNPDGGWASFDRCCDKEVLTLIPFADHNAMIDPSTPDITARVISALLAHGHDPGDGPVRRATDYLLREQETDGSWPGRWGANGIYGTWLALSALAPLTTRPGGRAGERLSRACRRGRRWLLAVQNEDGGWGESLRSYDDAAFRGRGRSTASQTAWAMMGLIASLESRPWSADAARTVAALDRAVAFLQERQRDDGSWYDRDWTGVGFPGVFYLRYHGYAQYFPLEALAAYRRLAVPEPDAMPVSDASVVSICGGEPTIYPELPELISGIIARRRHIYLCTNALLLDTKVFDRVPPNRRLTLNVHLDGMRETHDYVCARDGVFDKAIEMIRAAKERGYHVTTNTTVFKETRIDEVEELCRFLRDLDIDGMLISPGYQYESVDRDIFLTRQDTERKFRRVLEIADEYKLTSTPMFLEFAAGLRDYSCSPWSTVTRTPLGWKGPCYLIGKRHYATYEEFWEETDWDYWESREDPLCTNCAMHSGFEASVVREVRKSPKDALRLAAWHLSG